MKKLEDIEKKNIFKVPDGYFEELPSIIQARVSKPASERSPFFRYALQYALPACVFIIALAWFYNNQIQVTQPQNAEEMIASIDTDQLISYLEDTEFSLDDLLETYELSDEDMDEIEIATYPDITDEDLDIMLEEYDFELNN
jgi:hypothetical protein